MQHQQAIDLVLQLAAQQGATAELLFERKQGFSLKAKQGEIDEQSLSDTSVLGLRLYREQQIGLAYTEALDEQALQTLVQQALDSSRYCQADSAHQLLVHQHQLRTPADLNPPEQVPSLVQGIELLLQMEAELLAKPKIHSLPYNGFGFQQQHRLLVNSQGLRAESQTQAAHLYAYALAQEGERNAMEGLAVAERDWQQISALRLVEQVSAESLAMLEGSSITSGRYDAVFSTEQLASLLDIFSLVFSGKAAVDGINPWADKLGQAVASSQLQLFDQALDSQGLGYSLFDAEGTACQNLCLLAEGQLQSLIHNGYSAHKLGQQSTGHASRSAKGALGISVHQWYLPAGNSSDAELRQGQYLEITGLQGLHSGANPISGDFSFGASGYLCRDGQRQQAVRGITLAGNFYQLLNQIQGIGQQSLWHPSRSCRLAPVRFAGLQVAS